MSHIDIAIKVFDTEIEYLAKLKSSIDISFAKACDIILATKGRVILCGIGKSGIIAKKIAATFSSIGKPSFFINAAEANHGDLGAISRDDVVIMLSNSGESQELVGVINYCKESNVKIISIVSNKNSTLYKYSDAAILIPAACEVSYISMPTTSTTLMSVIGDAFATVIVENHKLSLDEYKKYHPGGSIGNSLIKVKEVMRTGSDIPVIDGEMMMSSALLIMTQKSLGCLVVVNQNNSVIGIITDGDLRRHMSEKLFAMKAKDIMTANPQTISSDEFAINALRIMSDRGITNLIVTHQGSTKGIIHMHDCLKIGLKITCDSLVD